MPVEFLKKSGMLLLKHRIDDHYILKAAWCSLFYFREKRMNFRLPSAV